MLEIGEGELECTRAEFDSIVAFADMIAGAEEKLFPAAGGGSREAAFSAAVEKPESSPEPNGFSGTARCATASPYRADLVQPSDAQEDVLRNAVNPDFGYFAVQKQG